jgi:hypothetical protein
MVFLTQDPLILSLSKDVAQHWLGTATHPPISPFPRIAAVQ